MDADGNEVKARHYSPERCESKGGGQIYKTQKKRIIITTLL